MTNHTKLSALVTAGPTIERLDPVRYISNFSSGKQGYAIAAALAEAGVEVTLISGPVSIPSPDSVIIKRVESAQQMLDTTLATLPVDIAICTAAVCDWTPQHYEEQKLKKQVDQDSLLLSLRRTPDILASLSTHRQRPRLVIGFAAETENVNNHAKTKLQQKDCDWILANDVSQNKVFGEETNTVSLLMNHRPIEYWPSMSKKAIAEQLVVLILKHLKKQA